MLKMFDSRMLRKVFGPIEEVVMGDWRKLHNVELHELYASPTIIWVTRSGRMRWVRNVAHMGKPEDHLEDQTICGRIILSCFLMKWEGRA